MGRREDHLENMQRLQKTYFRPNPKRPFSTLPIKRKKMEEAKAAALEQARKEEQR